MEDENKTLSIIKIVSKVFIVLVIIVIIVVIFFKINRNNETNKLNTYLKNNGYKLENKVYYKEDKKETNNYTTITYYSYDTKKNLLLKEITTNSTTYREQSSLIYNGSNEIKITYSYTKYSPTERNKTINQSGTYNYKTNDFNCQIGSNNGNLKTRCSVLLKQSKKLNNEVNKILEEAKINSLFTQKNAEV